MAINTHKIFQYAGRTYHVKLVFCSKHILLRLFGAGGITLSHKMSRFKRDRPEVPRELIAHELGHIVHATKHRMTYILKYIFNKRNMELEADLIGETILTISENKWLYDFGSMRPIIPQEE